MHVSGAAHMFEFTSGYLMNSGHAAVETWLAAHPEATRVRRSVEEIAASGLTLAKLTVAANLLGDLVKA